MYVPPRVIRPLDTQITWRASSDLPTKHGLFRMHVFSEFVNGSEREHVAMVFGDVAGKTRVPVRVHSECLTSEVFGSLKCDCREQLEAALQYVADAGGGAVLYLRQEGRGIGLVNKIRAYDLQSRGHDTVDANRLLGLADDLREYDVAAFMLEHLHILSVKLLTNNPEKVRSLQALGVIIEEREPVVIAPNRFSRGYLEAKRERMAHILPDYDKPREEAVPDSEPRSRPKLVLRPGAASDALVLRSGASTGDTLVAIPVARGRGANSAE